MDFVLISRLYMQEGALRRISASKYAKSFYLKGGLLLYSISGFTSRPTQDIDLLGFNIPEDKEQVRDILQEVLSIQAEDGLGFLTDKITLETITGGAEYQGQRAKITCTLGNIRTVLKLDIGFGDVVYPEPVQMDYPTLLKDNEFMIYTYSLESVIAEKFEAMIVLDARNSRMKDFYDVYDLLSKNELTMETLSEAIKQTMLARHTPTPKRPAIFTDDFVKDPRNLQLWDGLLKRIKAAKIDFIDVMSIIRLQLEPIYEDLIRQSS
jgi:predicted nucleotidyltransferase component of viral defense system